MFSRDANMGSFNATEGTNNKLARWNLKGGLRSLLNLGSRAISPGRPARMNYRCELAAENPRQ